MNVANETLDEMERMRDAPVGVPHGWRLVPMDSTIDMELKGRDAATRRIGLGEAGHIYRAMLAAAPAAPSPAAQEPVSGVVLRDGLPTLLQDKFIRAADQRLYTAPPAAEQPGTVAVPRELLREALAWLEVNDAGFPTKELRALLDGGEA